MYNLLRRFTGLAVFMILWQLVSDSGLVPQKFVPSLRDIGAHVVSLLSSTDFYTSLYATLARSMIGLLIAVAVSLGLAFIAGHFPLVRRALEPLVDILRSLPPPVLVPLLIFVIGIGPELLYFVVIFGSMWPTYISASSAFATVEPVQVNTARSLGLGSWQIMWQVRLPAAMPEIFTGIRLSASISVLSTVASEMILGRDGLGALIYNTGFSMLWSEMYALLFVIGIIGIVMNALVILLHWQFSGWSIRYSAMGNAQ
jgi:NitT/TauT family transport system permease protein